MLRRLSVVAVASLLAFAPGCSNKTDQEPQAQSQQKKQTQQPSSQPAAPPLQAEKSAPKAAQPSGPAETKPSRVATPTPEQKRSGGVVEPVQPAPAAPAPPPKAETPVAPAAPAPKPPPQAPSSGPQAKPPAQPIVLIGAPLGGVRFEHAKHKFECQTCHHPSREPRPATAPQQACTNCHTKPPQPGMKTFKQAAFHNPTAAAGTCIDCHKKSGGNAPTKCTQCHKKENG